MEYRYLMFVEGDANHNKYYEMIPNGSGFTVKYGRVGASPMEKDYPESEFGKKLREKLRKGYQDVTQLHRKTAEVEWLREKNADCDSLVSFLLSVCRQKIAENYDCSTDAITPDMVETAQRVLSSISIGGDVGEINRQLEKLYSILPRRMQDVSSYLVKPSDSDSERKMVLEREQDLLDTLAGQVKANMVTRKAAESGRQTTLLGAFDTAIRLATPDEKNVVYGRLGSFASKVYRIYAVTNNMTERKFNEWKGYGRSTELLWHGSRTENWLSIVATGLSLNPNAVVTGKMFGYGIYFAPSPGKSAGYTDMKGSRWANGHGGRSFLGLFEVHTGRSYKVRDYSYGTGSMTLGKLHDKGNYDCLWADSSKGMLRADEVIVYDDSQASIRYLVELNQ